MEWGGVVDRLVELQESGRLRVQITQGKFSAKSVAMRIMRKENYFVGMMNSELLPFRSDLHVLEDFSRALSPAHQGGKWFLSKSLMYNIKVSVIGVF